MLIQGEDSANWMSNEFELTPELFSDGVYLSMSGYGGYPRDEWDSRMTGWVENRTGEEIGSMTRRELYTLLEWLYDTNQDGMLTMGEATTEL